MRVPTAFYIKCLANRMEIGLNLFSGKGGFSYSQLSLKAVTGPLAVDAEGNITYGNVIATATLLEGPTEVRTNSHFFGSEVYFQYTFKFDIPSDDLKKVKAYIYELGDRVLGETQLFRFYYGSLEFPIYVKINVYVTGLWLGCLSWEDILPIYDDKQYDKIYGEKDGVPTHQLTYEDCYQLEASLFELFFTHLKGVDYFKAIMNVYLSGSISSFYKSITIHNKRGRCIGVNCPSPYVWQVPGVFDDCFTTANSDKTIEVSREQSELIKVGCPERNVIACRYTFSVPGKDSKFDWEGFLVDGNYVHFVISNPVYLNRHGKDVKLVIFLYAISEEGIVCDVSAPDFCHIAKTIV